jgi:hypothetical protein
METIAMETHAPFYEPHHFIVQYVYFSHKTFIVGKIIILQYLFDNVQYIHLINKYSLNTSWLHLCSLFMGLIIQHVLIMMKLI